MRSTVPRHRICTPHIASVPAQSDETSINLYATDGVTNKSQAVKFPSLAEAGFAKHPDPDRGMSIGSALHVLLRAEDAGVLDHDLPPVEDYYPNQVVRITGE